MRKLTLFILVLSALSMQAQYISGVTTPDTSVEIINDVNLPPVMIANSIQAEDIKEHLTVLASDAYEGRETGQPGNNKAAKYIAGQFQTMGLPALGKDNSYFQQVAFHKTSWKNNQITINGNKYEHLKDYLTFASMNMDMGKVNPKNVVFLGYGIDDPAYSDYKGNNLRGKIILINEGEPVNKDGISYITKSTELSDWNNNIYKKLEVAKNNGVKYVFVISNDIKKFLAENRRNLLNPTLQLGDGKYEVPYASHAYISPGMARDLIGKRSRKVKRWRKKNLKKGKAKDIKLKSAVLMTMDKQSDVIEGQNVMGYIEGTDKKDELIVVSAHYDHLGIRGKDIYNGADDNASGTSTVLELAEAFKLAKDMGVGPRRSVLCLLVTGEEKGLLGSQYYAEDPVFPLEKTVANVNIDMVGRTDKKYANNSDYIYVIGSDRLSTDLHKINEEMNQKYAQLTLDYKYNDEKDRNRYYYRSDHYNFAKNGIPAIFFFNGVHDDYHRTSDTIEKIQFDVMEKRGRLFFHTAWELANRENRIVVDGIVKP